MNVSRDTTGDLVDPPGACDILPADLEEPHRISVGSFLPHDLRSLVEQYFAMDVTLYGMVQRLSAGRHSRDQEDSGVPIKILHALPSRERPHE
jgi:hypothetical protein